MASEIFVIRDDKVFLAETTDGTKESVIESSLRPISEEGFVKVFEGFYVFMRYQINQVTLKPMKGFFKQGIKVSVPRRKELTYCYLSKQSNELYVRCFTGNQVTAELDLKDPEPMATVKLVGKAQRISRKTFAELMKDKAYLGLRSEDLAKRFV